MAYNDDEAARTAIRALSKVAQDNELLGYGSLPPIEMRIEAAHSLGTYLPHPDAVKALEKIMGQTWAPKELRIAATRALANRG